MKPNTDSESRKHKRCANCSRWKLLTEFYCYAKAPDGRQYHCKDCQNSRGKVQVKVGKRANSYMPRFVRCMVCSETCECALDNKFWLNQYSDDMAHNHALCSERCYRELVGVVNRMAHMRALESV